MLPALIAAGAGLVNGVSQLITNKSNKKFAREQYQTQRKDALTDAAFQNEYNSPAATMARLKAAGLNPNLAYGSGATTVSAPIRSSSASTPDGEAPQIDGSGIANAMTIGPKIKQTKLETDNLLKQGELLDANINSQNATTEKIKTDTANTQYDLDYKILTQNQRVEQNTQNIQSTKAGTGKKIVDTQFTTDENLRKAAMQSPNLKSATLRVLQQAYDYNTGNPAKLDLIRAQIEKVKTSTLVDKYEIELNKSGLTKGSSEWLQLMKKIMDESQGPVQVF